jgi:hypothetical protein
MKQYFTHKQNCVLAVLAVIVSMTNVACNKEKVTEMERIEHQLHENQVFYYIVDSECHRIALVNDADWDAFLERMLALVKEGHKVCFGRNVTRQIISFSKEKITFVTTDFNKIKKWAKEKVEEGYEVEITYNEQTGEYTGIAVR